jgi:hypothetical protein
VSTTFVPLQEDFEISYVDQSGVQGSYFQDSLTVGNLQLQNFTMATASTFKGQSNIGVMGIGIDQDEASAPTLYPNFIDALVSQGSINTRAYSLYLDDLDAASGTLLLGGYDTAKYLNELVILDLQSNASFDVPLTAVALSNPMDTTLLGGASDLPALATLDSGTSLTYLPPAIFNQLAAYFGATISPDQSGTYLVSCSTMETVQGSLLYQFAGSAGPIIQVPFSELSTPSSFNTSDGSPACTFGVGPGDAADGYLLGDTFLRSAYVVYDLDNLQVGIANTVFNAKDSNVVEIQNVTNPIPGSTAAFSSLTATATETALPLPDGGSLETATSFGPVTLLSAAPSLTAGVQTSLSATNLHGTSGVVKTSTGPSHSPASTVVSSDGIKAAGIGCYSLVVGILVFLVI